MKWQIRPITERMLLSRVLAVTGLLWAASTSFLALKMRPETLVILSDEYGTRLLEESEGRGLEREKHALLRRFLFLSYTYSSKDFEKRISEAGDLMSTELWQKKQGELQSIANNLATVPLQQEADIEEIREIDETNFEADIAIQTRSRLKEVPTKLRVTVRLSPHKRTRSNPYPFEVNEYVEQVL